MKTQIDFQTYVEILNDIKELDSLKKKWHEAREYWHDKFNGNELRELSDEQQDACSVAYEAEKETFEELKKASIEFENKYGDLLEHDYDDPEEREFYAITYWDKRVDCLCNGFYEIVR